MINAPVVMIAERGADLVRGGGSAATVAKDPKRSGIAGQQAEL
jgi:hypothetical protein